jgi:hypothetical protein
MMRVGSEANGVPRGMNDGSPDSSVFASVDESVRLFFV